MARRRKNEVIRIVVVEDSPLITEALVHLCEEDPRLQVVATAATGMEAIEAVLREEPDVVTLDLGLPDIDGFEVAQQIMADRPTPILVLTATLRPEGRREAYDALSLGAVDVMKKPTRDELADVTWRDRFRRELQFIARARVMRHVRGRLRRPSVLRHARPVAGPEASAGHSRASRRELIAIVGSSGGPLAATALLKTLQQGFPLSTPVIVALHLGAGMEGSFASYLRLTVGAPTAVLTEDTRLVPGVIYVAPGAKHLELSGSGRVRLLSELPRAVYTPSLDYFLWSAARVHGAACAAAVLSGMGADGADGLLVLRQAGGLTLAQDEASSLIYGMPRVASELGAAARQQSPPEMAHTLLRWLQGQEVADEPVPA